jgi:hypothetical protein
MMGHAKIFLSNGYCFQQPDFYFEIIQRRYVMKRLQLIAAALVLIFSGSAVAQTSNGTGGGKWSASATWTGGNVPTGSGTITIQSTDSLYIDVAVTITGTLRSFSGKIGIYDSTKVVFGSGGVYEHDINGGTLPKAVWNTGSTCLD